MGFRGKEMNMVEINNLTRDYGGGRGVFDLRLSLQAGEAFGFLGPNGAGKTTTLRHLMGFLSAQSGTCSIKGLDCFRDSAAIQQTLGYIPGEISFFDDMKGSEFLTFCAKYRGINPKMDRSRRLTECFELDPSPKIKKMSKGTKQKLGIVSAFMHDPDILLLDEPSGGLDPLMQTRFIDLVKEEKGRGKTILLSTHMFEEVERTCARVGIIKEGRLVAVDSVDALRAAQVKKYILSFENAQAAAAFAGEHLQTEPLGDGRISVTVQNNLHDLILLMQKYPVSDISSPDLNLEEIFMHYYGGESHV